jgi:hypothetical protein
MGTVPVEANRDYRRLVVAARDGFEMTSGTGVMPAWWLAADFMMRVLFWMSAARKHSAPSSR